MVEKLPSGAAKIAKKYAPVLSAAWRRLCKVRSPRCTNAASRELAIAVGAESEGAVHSHVRRGLDEGLSADDLLHVSLLAIPSIGLAKAVAAMTWIEDILKDRERR